MMTVADEPRALPFDPEAPLTASGNLRRRAIVSHVLEGGAIASALVAIAVLGIVAYAVAARGATVLSLDFLTKDPPRLLVGGGVGGIAPYIVGTVIMVALATVIATPIGVLLSVYMTEFASPRTSKAIRVALGIMYGLPTIIVGLFVWGLMVRGSGGSGLAGGVALSIIMLPLVARSSEEVLLLVPRNLHEAADALGVERWRKVVGVVLPTAMGGILTGTILAFARAAGETAPLLFVAGLFGQTPIVNANPLLTGQGMASISVGIYQNANQGDPTAYSRAWGMAFVLLAAILIANVGARTLLARSRRKLGG